MFKCISLILFFTYQTIYPLTTLQVTISSDNNPGGIGEIGDLRYCLNSMNESLNTSPDDYEIVFDFPMTIQLNGILPIINNSANSVNITIGNSGSIPTVTIDGNNGTYPGFFIPMGNVTIQNINFQNLAAKGGNGGDGISGGGGGMGAGAAIFAPEVFLNGSYPSIILKNVAINSCSAIGGNGGSFIGDASTGNEGGGGGGGFFGNGGSVVVAGITGGAGGGGFGGNGGNVTLSADDEYGGGGGGGGGLGSAATLGTLTNLGNGGSDQTDGLDGNGYGLVNSAGSGGGGNSGGNNAGGGGGGAGSPAGGGGGGSCNGHSGSVAEGSIPPGGESTASGGIGADGGGGGGGAIVISSLTNSIDGQAGSGGYAGGGGGGAGTGSYDSNYTVQGGNGGIAGGGGGGGVNQSGQTSAAGGNSFGGGGGGGGGPSDGLTAAGGADFGYLGGGSGGAGADSYGSGFGGGGGGGGSALGAAIFVDSNINFTIQALSGIPTFFNTTNNTTQAGSGGSGGTGGGLDGQSGSALGNSIFLRSGASLSFIADGQDDILTLGDQVSFVDDTSFGGLGTGVSVRGQGTIIYYGTTDYQGQIMINNANFKVYGQIDQASILVCRNRSISMQRGILSGTGTLTGDVFVNSGTIAPDAGGTLTLGSLILNSANPDYGWVGSLVRTQIVQDTTNLVSVTGPASLAGILEIDIQEDATPGSYIILTSSGITGIFDFISFLGETPIYRLSYLPVDAPTYVQFDFLGFLQPPSDLQGEQFKNDFGFEYELYNQLTWTASTSSQVTGYIIYRQGEQIATVDASVTMYQDHNQTPGVIVDYSLAAFDAQGNISPLISLSVPRR
ncbi:MAG: hypothetical protein ACXWL5_03480 [Candidatus Chromulinivorax sp.]